MAFSNTYCFVFIAPNLVNFHSLDINKVVIVNVSCFIFQVSVMLISGVIKPQTKAHKNMKWLS